VYHALVRRKIERIFSELSLGNYDFALAGVAPYLEHSFAGDHPLGGVRHTAAALRLWFERLYRLFPMLRFSVKHMAVSGWPWDTTVVVEWHDKATLATGAPYDNDGVHVVRLRWGRLVSLHAYLDTAVVADACRRMANDGVEEARSPWIEN
jgi:ketosteroid isomerase-like protein